MVDSEREAYTCICEVASDKKHFLPLLLLGDEQESMIDRYLDRGRLFVLLKRGEPIAVCVVTDESGGICEIKNLAVAVPHQRRGYGRKMIEYVQGLFAPRFHTLQVGTGEVPSTMGFYQRCGFVVSRCLRDFFLEHYDHAIVEDGILLRDMVVLKKDLSMP